MTNLGGGERLNIFNVLAEGEVPVGFQGPIVETAVGKLRDLVVANTNVEHTNAEGEKTRITRVVQVPAEGHQ